ncbi:uncharacterized protein PG986_003732 [Apiospora aurea]|uniref:Uncharacterized protein n=1 Tax=Apiospora aurea TaxID=335848 RepID=A0ABR1QTG4_9PEZI
MTSNPNYFLMGAVHRQWMQGELPPLLPAGPPNDDADWDSSVVVHGDWMRAPAERRHSGWNAVEQSWSNVDGASTAREETPVQSQTPTAAERFEWVRQSRESSERY